MFAKYGFDFHCADIFCSKIAQVTMLAIVRFEIESGTVKNNKIIDFTDRNASF